MQLFSTLLLSIALFLSACSQKVNVRSLVPAQVDRASLVKKVSVSSFKNDKVELSAKIESTLSQQIIDTKHYFTIVNRSDLDKIIKEKRLQSSGLLQSSTAAEIGSLIGAESIISGNVGKITSSDSYYYAPRTKCADEKCKKVIKYKVKCLKRLIGLSAELRMIDVAQGDIIYADTLRESKGYSHCSDDSQIIPDKNLVAQYLAQRISKKFVYKLTPHYRNFRVVLLEKPDFKYSNNQERLLDVSLEYIEQKRYDKAEQFLVELIDSTDQRSYVPFYNLGVIKEIQGNYSDAQSYYATADSLMVEPVDEISSAYLRIQKTINNTKITQQQLAR
jgi:PBP1b-binding outer membrane lipoprotein LpoB